MAGSTVTSTLDIRLVGDVTPAAAKVAASLQKLEAEAKIIDAALGKAGASDRLQGRIRNLGATASQVEGVGKAWRDYAKAESLAADHKDWTKAQAAAVRNWETVTVAGIRAVIAAEHALEKTESAAATAFERSEAKRAHAAQQASHRIVEAHRSGGHGEHFDKSTLGGAGAAYAAYTFEHMSESVLERYQDFDKERRYGKVVMGLTDQQQEPLVQQALKGGATSRFNDIQWLEAQREFAARGYKIDQVMAFTGVAADIGAALDKSLPESVKLIEGAMLGFGKDVSTYDKAVAAARQTADLQVKTSKVSGMDAEDIQALYKYGAAPAKMAGLSEQSLLAYGAVSKKSNIGGDEAGTAFRAMAKNLVSPTAGAIVAMRASGIDYSKYQRAPKEMDLPGFTAMVAQRYGVQLSDKVQAGLGRIFKDAPLLGDPSKFMPAVTQYLKGALGGNDAKSLKSIAGLARQYRDASAGGVDADRLMEAIIECIGKNPNLANAIFGGKAGGKIFAALGDEQVYHAILDLIHNHSEGYAHDVAEARNQGFNGEVAQLKGAIATLESSIGRAFDDGGKGGPLTELTHTAAEVVRALSELPAPAQRAAVEVAAAAAAFAGLKGLDFIKGGFGLTAAGGEMVKAGDIQLRAGELMLEAAGGGLGRGGRPGAPGGPHEEPKPGEGPGGTGEVAPKTGELAPKMPAPEGRPGIYGGPPKTVVPDVPPKTGFFSGGGLKGLAGGLAEGVIGAIIYDAGRNAIDYFMDKIDKDHQAKFDKVMDRASLPAMLERVFGTFGDDKRSPDPYRTGDRAGIDERARRGADDFMRDPEGTRGRRMMERDTAPPPAPYVDPETRRDRIEARQAFPSIAVPPPPPSPVLPPLAPCRPLRPWPGPPRP